MEKLGTEYGGWYVPTDLDLNENSVVYSVGVGEDISFDLLLNHKYQCDTVLIDPTPRAILHFKEVKEYYKNKDFKFTGNVQQDYYRYINNLTVNLDKFTYVEKGLWNSEGVLKFYKQDNKNYVSCSLIEGVFSSDYDEICVDKIKNIMKELNHTKIDLLKMDIEGAELNVLNDMLNDSIHPKYVLVEFDLSLKNKDKNNLTDTTIKRLKETGYKILKNDNLNITFKYEG